MVFKQLLQKLRESRSDDKELLHQAEREVRIQKIIEEKQKSSNLRELERYMKEDQEQRIKEELDYYRKKRDYDIKFNHNPLNTKNITKEVEWEVLREKNQFSNNKNLFVGNPSVLKNNPRLLKNNKRMYA